MISPLSHESWVAKQEMSDSLNFTTRVVGSGNTILVENMFIKRTAL